MKSFLTVLFFTNLSIALLFFSGWLYSFLTSWNDTWGFLIFLQYLIALLYFAFEGAIKVISCLSDDVCPKA